MVGLRFVGLRMVPNDQGRSAQGPRPIFCSRIPDWCPPGPPGPPGPSRNFYMFSHVASNKRLSPMSFIECFGYYCGRTWMARWPWRSPSGGLCPCCVYSASFLSTRLCSHVAYFRAVTYSYLMLSLSSLSTARADRDSALPGQTSKSRQVTVRRAARTEDNFVSVS